MLCKGNREIENEREKNNTILIRFNHQFNKCVQHKKKKSTHRRDGSYFDFQHLNSESLNL